MASVIVCCLGLLSSAAISRSLTSALLPMRTVTPKLQYGAQNYGGQQNYGYDQQGYGQQEYAANYGEQQGYGSLWRVDGFCGVTGFAQPGVDAKYAALPYVVQSGDETVLSRWNMVYPKLTVSRAQAIVRIQTDGTPTLISCGRPATLWRRGGSPWNGLVKGQSHILADGDQVSLDSADPEGAVFSCVHLQGACPQLGGLPEPIVVPQQQGGYYPQQQGGGYPQQSSDGNSYW